MSNNWSDDIKWNQDGLVPAIAQDYQTGEVLMMAWMNKEALELTVAEQRAIYFSRSRQKLWRKGEDSGHVQKLHDIRLDCDSDLILMKVDQIGGIACHTGRRHCLFKQLQPVESSSEPVENSAESENHSEKQWQWVDVDPVLKDPKSIYQK